MTPHSAKQFKRIGRLAVLLTLSLTFLPSLGRAEPMSVGQACQQLIGTQVVQCLAAPRNQYIDPNAVGACSRLIGLQVIDCISTIAGKVYQADVVAACDQLIGRQVIDCFASSGSPYVAPQPQAQCGQQPLANVRARLLAALESLRVGDSARAYHRLSILLERLQ